MYHTLTDRYLMHMLKTAIREDLEKLVKGHVKVFWDRDTLYVDINAYSITFRQTIPDAFLMYIHYDTPHHSIVMNVYDNYVATIQSRFFRELEYSDYKQKSLNILKAHKGCKF